MTTLADILIAQGAPGREASDALRWLADWLPDAERRILGRDDLAHIDAYRGEAMDLHQLLPSILPLARPVWYEAPTTALGGTEMIMGYGAVPAGADCVDIGWACYAPAHGRIIGPLGPGRVTSGGMAPPFGLSDESWRELRAAGGIVIRALLLRLGTPAP